MGLIGRRRELAAVRQLLDRATAGSGGHLMITGPPGSGRTALVEAAVHQARERGLPVARATGTGPGRWIWTRVLRDVDGGGPEPADPPTAADLDTYARAIADGGPRLIVVDDLDRAGPPATEFLARLTPHLASGATALLTTAVEPLTPAAELRLRGLSETELADLLPALPADAVHAVWLASAGLPATALDLAGELAERDAGVDAVVHLALTRPSRAEFLDLDAGLLRLLEEAAVRPAPPATRARVLARLARELLGDPSAAHRRRSLVDEALRLARGAVDPRTIAEVLDARLHALWDPAAARERLGTATEIVTQARLAGETAIELRGLFWRFVALAELGDLAAAEAALAGYARVAELAGDPEAPVVVLARQAMLATVRGRFAEAETLTAEMADRGRRIGLADTERLARSLYGRLALYRGQAGTAEVAVLRGLARRLPGHYFEATAARTLAETGGDTEAALELERLLPTVLAGTGPRWVGALADLAVVAHRTDVTGAAEALYDALLPYQGRLVVWGGANTITGPVDDYLGRLAVRLGRPEQALSHLDDAVRLERRIGALPWEAYTLVVRAEARSARSAAVRPAAGPAPAVTDDRKAARDDLDRARMIADRLGMAGLRGSLAGDDAGSTGGRSARGATAGRWSAGGRSADRASAGEPGTGEWRLVRDGDDWRLDAGRESARLRDARGLHHLRILLANPGREIAALDLVAGGAGLRLPEGEPMLDETARRAYRDRVRLLDEQLASADRAGDVDRATGVQAERSALLAELRRASGLGGRPRPQTGEAERARVSATRALWAAVNRVETVAPLAGAHLRASLRTGRFLRYQPAPGGPTRWRV